MKPIHLVLLLAVSLFVGCKRNTDLSEAQRAAITSDVNRVISATADSINLKGFIGWIPFFHKSSDFAWVSYDISTPYDTLILQIARSALQNRSVTVKWDRVLVQALAEDEASVVANYLETLVDTTGKSSQLSWTVMSTLVKVGDSWKFNKVQTFPNE